MHSLNTQKKPLNGQKRNVQKKLFPLSTSEKGPCAARLLPTNVGVPKILSDRKFPILRCVLKSCGHPNAVTVILLALIASLHPHFCASVLLFQKTVYFIYSTEQSYAGLLLITCRRAPGTVCSTGR